MALFYPKVWTGHIMEAIHGFDKPSIRLVGVFATELEAADKVREKRVPGFDERGWVTEWDVRAAQAIFNVTVFDKGWVPR